MKYVFGEKIIKTPHGEYLRPEEIKENEKKYGVLKRVRNDSGQVIRVLQKGEKYDC